MMKLTLGYGIILYQAVTLLQGRITINTLFLLPSSVYRKRFAEWGGGQRGAPIGNCSMSQKFL